MALTPSRILRRRNKKIKVWAGFCLSLAKRGDDGEQIGKNFKTKI